MATPVEEFTLESVRDYMISRDGRVTNHELVKHFKNFLTNPACKELARNKFKQYVNTLANISQEGGEKYLVLKRKYRVGTHLSESEYLPQQNSPVGPRFASPNQFSPYGSPQHAGGYSPQGYNTAPPPVPPPPYRSTPPYRAPPPYRPPPPATPTQLTYPSPDEQYGDRRYDHAQPFNGRQQGSGDPRYRGEAPRYPPTGDPRYPQAPIPPDSRYNEGRCTYDEPSDLGIPPAPQVIRSPSSLSSSSSGAPYQGPHPSHPSYGGYNNQPPPLVPLGASRPKSLPIKSANSSLTSPSEDGDSVFGGDDMASASTLSVTTTGSSLSTPSSDEPPPPVPPRKRPGDNKENRRPSPEGEEGNRTNVMGGGGGSDVPDGAGAETPASAEDERKISVKEVSQKFNRMASEVQLIPSSRGSSKSNRSSRSDRDDDDSSSIHSQYGPEGQEWIVAAAKSDFNEILRLLKIHPSLARYKVNLNQLFLVEVVRK
ncbi:WAS/WASL-interacting protein family member 1-like isoform X2 [Macrobrachium rosenbergii]|uniref:WAS/WASL-interacting protein family member 1-like isoform X2 n=1 Tax=Macrobrachium rosenbergii TaxID=79674 RepID=UPI0034D454C3